MKQKDTIYLVFAVAIFLFIGIFLYGKLGPGKNQGKPVQVEIVDPIPDSLNQQALTALKDPAKTVDYTVNIDLNNLGNGKPFGPLQ